MTDTYVKVTIPQIATKHLKFRHNANRKILTISSNFLSLFGFEKGNNVTEESLGPYKGIRITKVDDLFDGPSKKVYIRRYTKRTNNPLEHQVEVSSQKLINASFPSGCNRVHVTFRHNELIIIPFMTIHERAIQNAKRAPITSVFAALTSGMDIHSMKKEGFDVTAVLEWRPPEARDKTDLSETGAICALENGPHIKAIFNEDITSSCLDLIAYELEKNPVYLFHASPQCDDLSNVKAQSLKDQSFDDASTTQDMILDLIQLVERIAPPVVLFENVPGMLASPAYHLASLRMKRWGYRRFEQVADARDHGGYTSRKRAYIVFSQLNAPFEFEKPVARSISDAFDIIAPFLHECRNVSHSKSLNDGKACGRLRTIKKGSPALPTILKSQERMAKDSVVIETEPGTFLWPSENLIKHLMGLNSAKLNSVSKTIASEIIGQSIDAFHHGSVLRAIKSHIASFINSQMIRTA